MLNDYDGELDVLYYDTEANGDLKGVEFIEIEDVVTGTLDDQAIILIR